MISDRLENAYLALPVGLRRLIPERWRIGLRNRLLPEWRNPEAGGNRARTLEDKLWGGFSRSALTDLEALRLSFTAHPRAASQAAWVLGRWQATRGEPAAALANLVFMRLADPAARRAKRQYLQEAKLLCLLGRGAEARALIAARAGRAFDSSVTLMRAASHSPTAEAGRADAAAALAEINAVYRHFGLAEIGRADPGRPLSIDNLAARTPPRPASGPLVSVLLPVFEAADTLPTALAGLAAQSWTALEVLILDDASRDATAEIAADFCARDPRFRLIRLAENGGSYAARNRGLQEAKGAFVTVHDADDWSHPEKIRLQAEALATASVPHNFTAWTRTLPDLMFTGTAQATRTLVSLNFSSHMIRRDALIAAGGWDHIRVTGDTELVWRIEALAGRPAEAFRGQLILPSCPLSFGRVSPASLTGAEATHVLSVHHGVRREYREAAAHWHAALRRGEGRDGLRALGVPRFPAPPALRPERPVAPPLDLLAIGDFNLRGGSLQSALAMLRAGRAAGLACGLLQYRRYDRDTTAPLSPAVRGFAQAEAVRIVAPGESLAARTVLFTHPPLAMHVMDRFPRIAHDDLVMVVNQMAERDLSGTDIAYDPARVRAHLGEMFGTEGHWAPISERVRALMASDPRYPTAWTETWTPLIDTGAWCARAPVWRGPGSGSGRAAPVLGRHGRDHPLKWPADPAALRAAYCADRACETRFLGGAKQARARLGRWPANWRALPFGEDAGAVRDFLADLDIFLHYPQADYIEEFGRAPMEAMAVGVPVILPPVFAATFGAAALYAEPEAVWPLVETLWRDEAAWRARVEAGRAFVAAECSYSALPARLARLPGRQTRALAAERALA